MIIKISAWVLTWFTDNSIALFIFIFSLFFSLLNKTNILLLLNILCLSNCLVINYHVQKFNKKRNSPQVYMNSNHIFISKKLFQVDNLMLSNKCKNLNFFHRFQFRKNWFRFAIFRQKIPKSGKLQKTIFFSH